MGLAIGQTSAQLSAVRTLTESRGVASRPGEAAPETPEGVQAGFGANTVSPAAAALLTLDGNLERARDIVPTVEELRAQLRAARAEAAANARSSETDARLAAAAEPPERLGAAESRDEAAEITLITDRESGGDVLPPPTPFRPEPGPEVRSFAEFQQPVLPPPPPDTGESAAGFAPTGAAVPQARLNLFA